VRIYRVFVLKTETSEQMTSITLVTPMESEETKEMISSSFPTDGYQFGFDYSSSKPIMKTTRAFSYNEDRNHSSLSSSATATTTTTTTSNNRFKHLCTQLKRRFSITKDPRTSHDENQNSTRSLALRFKNYKSFSSSFDDSFNEFDWPDFERIYDRIPHCLTKTLPGLDDISLEDDEEADTDPYEIENFTTDHDDELEHLFKYCKRGQHYRRNAICRKIDKNIHHGQLDTFIQQLMVEKLMRTWT